MRFTKMHGAGNDYIYVNCFEESVTQDLPTLARDISDRHFGVGGDGLILICPSEHADAEMRMFNADGSEAEMCGNGIRCVAKYIYDHRITEKKSLVIDTGAGPLALEVEVSNGQVQAVRVDMGEPQLEAGRIPTTLSGNPVVNRPLRVGERELEVTCVSMGNPHCVVFVENTSDEWVLNVGPQLEIDPHFPARINSEFVEVISPTELRQRTWERGSGETLACGTGASAVCVAGVLTGRSERNVRIQLLGGDLDLEWNETDNHVYMTGPAEEVFQGEWPS